MDEKNTASGQANSAPAGNIPPGGGQNFVSNFSRAEAPDAKISDLGSIGSSNNSILIDSSLESGASGAGTTYSESLATYLPRKARNNSIIFIFGLLITSALMIGGGKYLSNNNEPQGSTPSFSEQAVDVSDINTQKPVVEAQEQQELIVNGSGSFSGTSTFNQRLGVGIAEPSFTLDVGGDINTSTELKIAGKTICTADGCIANNIPDFPAAVSSLNGLVNAVTIQDTAVVGQGIVINNASTSTRGLAQFNSTNFSVSGGVVNTIQGIGLSSSPTFAGLTLSSPLAVSSGGTGASSFNTYRLLVGNGTNGITETDAAASAGLCLISNAGAAPSFQGCPGGSGGSTVTTQNPTTANKLPKFSGATTITDSNITDNNTTVDVGIPLVVGTTITSPVLQSTGALTLTPGSTFTAGAVNQQFILRGNSSSIITGRSGSFTTTLGFTAPTADRAINLPNEGGTVCLQNSSNCGFSTTGSGVTSVNTLTGAVSIVGTTNQVNVATGATIVLSTPQNIATSSTPQFAGLGIGVAGSSSNIVLSNSSNIYANNLLQTTAGQGITIDAVADAITLKANGRSFIFPTTGGASQTICTTGVTCVAGGGQAVLLAPGAAQADNTTDVSVFINKTNTGNILQLQASATDRLVLSNSGTLSVNTVAPISGTFTLGSTGNTFTLQGSSTSTITATGGGQATIIGFDTSSPPAGTVTYQFDRSPTGGANTYTICTTDGNCSGLSGAVTSPGGTAGRLAKFTDTNVVQNSILSESGTVLTAINGSLVLQGAAGLTLGVSGGSGATGKIDLKNTTNTNTLTLQSGATASNLTFTLPVADGSNGQCIKTNASGVLSFGDCLSGAGGGGGVTSLNGNSGSVTVQGTTNQVIVTGSGVNPIILSTPQDIATTSSPTFQTLTLNGTASAGLKIGSNNTAGKLIIGDGAATENKVTINTATLGADKTILIPAFSGSSATLPLTASGFITVDAAGDIHTTGTLGIGSGGTGASTAATARSNLSAAQSGANGDITSTSLLNTITPNGSLTVGASGQSFTLQGNTSSTIKSVNGVTGTTTVSFATPSANRSIVFPDAAGTVCLLEAANCLGGGSGGANTALSNLTSVAINTSLLSGAATIDLGSGANPFRDLYLGGTATNNFRFTGTAGAARTITLSDNSGTLALLSPTAQQSGNLNISGTVTSGAINGQTISSAASFTGSVTVQGSSGLTLGVSSSATGRIDLKNSTNTNTLTLQSGATGSNLTFTLPTADGSSGQCIKTNASGVLSFGDCLSGSGSGGGVTQLNTLTGAVSILGTANQVTVTTSSPNITLSLPQSIATTSSPTFAGLTLSSPLSVANGGTGAATFSTNGLLYGNGTSAIQALANGSSGQCLIANSGAAPSWTNCTGLVTLQNAYNNGNTIDTPASGSARDILFTLTNSSGTDSNFLVNIATSSSSKFAIQNNGTDIFQALNGEVRLGNNALTELLVVGDNANDRVYIQGGTASDAVVIWAAAGGTVGVGTAASNIVNVGTGTSSTVTIGSTSASNTVAIRGGTGASAITLNNSSGGTISIGTGNYAGTINIGMSHAAGGISKTIGIGDTTIGQSFVSIGSSDGSSSTSLKAGTGGISINASVSSNTSINTGTSTGTISIGNTSAGALTLQSGSTINFGTGGVANTIQIGNTTGAVAQTINIANNATASSTSTLVLGSTIGTSSTSIRSGPSGTINIGNTGSTSVILIGNSAGATSSVTLGSPVTTSATTIQAGSGGINIGAAGVANTIQIGNTTGAVAQTINIGNNVTVGASTTVTLGSLSATGTNTTNIHAGSGGINLTTSTAGAGTLVRTSNNSTAAFQIQNAAFTNLLAADTTNMRISIGSAGTATGQLYVSGSVPTGATGSVATGTSPQSIYVQGRYAYVVYFGSTTFQVFDVSNPATPVSVGSVSTGGSTGNVVKVQGRYAYTDNGGSLRIIDISNPASPANVGSLASSCSSGSLYAQGRYVYCADDSGLRIIDVGNPASPVSVGFLASACDAGFNDLLYVQGRYVYCGTGSNNLQIIDVSNPASPVSVGSVSVDGTFSSLYVQGRYAYVKAAGGLKTVDVSNPASPVQVSTLGSVCTGFGLYVQGRYAYCSTSNALQIIDVSNPASPASIGTVATTSTPYSVYVQGRYAYVVNNTGNNLQVFDVGGSYIQQLEAGGIETGTLQVRSNLTVNNDADIRGGLTVGQSLQVSGNLAVSGSNIVLSGSNSGELGSWSTNSNALPAVRGGHSSVTANGYVYALGGTDGTVQSTVYYAKLNTDGSTGSWSTTTALPAGRTAGSSVVANGYIYFLGGLNGSGQTTVYYAKLNGDGTVGSWNTTTALPIGKESHTSVVANGYVYVIGGVNNGTTYYAKLNGDGTVGSWNTTSSLSATIEAHSSVVANGYVYVIGGRASSTYQTAVQYAQLNSDGTLSGWSSSTALPANRAYHSSVVSNGYVYVLGGTTNGTTYESTAYYAKLNSNGTVGSWSTNANALPATRVRFSSIIANGYVYVMGGYNGSYQSTVYYTSTSRVQIGASLDLVGLQGQNLAGPGDFSQGSTGGSITAGNGTFVGSLQVLGQANFSQNVGITGILSSGNLTVTDTSTTSVAKFLGSGSTQCTVVTGTGWSCSSDERLKTNIQNITSTDALSKLMQLQAVSYNWLADASGSLQNGFIAQQIQQILPELVTTDSNGYLSLNKDGLLPYIVGAVQEQQSQITELQQKVGIENSDGAEGEEYAQSSSFSELNVSGPATIENLTVTGSTKLAELNVTGSTTLAKLTVSGDATFKGTLTIEGHIITGGSTPTGSAGTGAVCAGGPQVIIEGTDTAGTVTITTGSGSCTGGPLANVAFTKAYGSTPKVVLTPKDANGADLKYYYNATSNSFEILASSAPAESTTYTYSYHVIQ